MFNVGRIKAFLCLNVHTMNIGSQNHNSWQRWSSTLSVLFVALSALFVLGSCATAPPPESADNFWDGYTSVAVSPNGRLAAAANRHMIVLFDIGQQRQVGWFWAIDDKGKSFTLSRPGLGDTLEFVDDFHIVTTGMGGLATIWDIRTGQKQQQIDAPANGVEAISLAWSPTRRNLAMGTRDGSILLVSLEGEKPGEIEYLLSHVGRVNDLVFSADGKYMASAAHDKTVVIWDMESRQEVSRHVSKGDISDLEAISSRRELIIAGDDVAIWQFLSEEEAVQLKEDKAIGQWVGTGAIYALQVGLIATGLGGGLSAHDPKNCGRFVSASPDGRYLVDVKPGPLSNKVTVLDLDQNELLHEVEVKQTVCDLEFTADGSRLVLAGDGGFHLVDTATWSLLPIQLIVDGFSHAPRVILGEPGQMGLSLTRHSVEAEK
jgi:WD40 repeat protein